MIYLRIAWMFASLEAQAEELRRELTHRSLGGTPDELTIDPLVRLTLDGRGRKGQSSWLPGEAERRCQDFSGSESWTL